MKTLSEYETIDPKATETITLGEFQCIHPTASLYGSDGSRSSLNSWPRRCRQRVRIPCCRLENEANARQLFTLLGTRYVVFMLDAHTSPSLTSLPYPHRVLARWCWCPNPRFLLLFRGRCCVSLPSPRPALSLAVPFILPSALDSMHAESMLAVTRQPFELLAYRNTHRLMGQVFEFDLHMSE